MAFNLNGSVIEQTGTDANLSALAGVGGTVATTYGNITQYAVPASRTFDIQGTLTIDPYRETLLITDAVSSDGATSTLLVSSSGTLNIGTVAVNGVFPEAIPAIVFGGEPGSWYSGAFALNNLTGSSFVVQAGGNFNWSGGAILGSYTCSWQGNTNITNNATMVVLDDGQPAGEEWLTRFFEGNISIGALNFVGGSISLGSGSEGSRYSIGRLNSGIAFLPQYVGGGNTSRRDPITIFDANTAGNTIDYGIFQQCVLNVENPLQGSAVSIRGQQAGNSSNNRGHCIVYRTLATNITNLAGDGVLGYFRLEDYNNNERKNLSVAGANINDTGQFIYDFPVNGTLGNNNITHSATSSHQFTPDNAIISCIVSTAGTPPPGTSNVGPYIKDLRGYTTLNADGLTAATSTEGNQNIRGYLWSYAEQPQVIDIDLDDNTVGDITVQRIITPDAAITRGRAATVADWNTGDVVFTTTGNITTGADMSTDDLYDFVKYRKVEDINLRSIPTLDTMPLELFNTLAVNAGTRTITLGGKLTGTANKRTVQAATFVMGGQDIENIVFNGSSTGNIGAVTGGSSFTTSNTSLQTVGSVHSSTIDSVGAITVTNDVTTSTVDSEGNVIVNGDVTAVDADAFGSTLISGGSTIVSGSIDSVSTITSEQAILVQTNAANSTITSNTSTVGITGNSSGCNIDGTTLSIGGTSTNDDIDATAAATVTGNVDGSDIKAVGLVTLGANITNLAKVDTDGNITVAGNANDVTLDGATIVTTGTSTEVTYISSGNTVLTGASTGGTITASGTTSVGVITEGEVSSVGSYTGTGAHTDTDVTVTGANNDITLNNQTVTNGTFISPDNISLSNGTSNGATFLALDNIQLAGSTSRHTDSTFRGDAVNNVVATTFVSGNTFGPATDGSNININLNIGSDTNTNLNTLLGTGWTFTSNGVATIRNTGSGTVTISVSEDDLTALGITLAAGSSTAEADGIVYNRPAAAAEPRTFGITAPKAGNLRYKVMGADGIGTLVDGNTAGAVIDTDNNDSSTYAIWWKPDSDVGEIYDYTYQEWSPMTQASTTIGDFQPDPASAITGNATELNFVATFSSAYDATSGEARFIITSADTAYMNAGLNQTLAWKMMNEDEYLQAVVNGNQTAVAADRLINFGSGTVGPTTGFVNDLIRVSSTTGQKSINGWSGFLTDVAGTDPDTFDTIISTSTNILFGSDAQISALAGGDAITALGDELKANQSNLKESIESNPYVAASALPFNTAD